MDGPLICGNKLHIIPINGVHTNGKTPLRKNFAGVGMTYDSAKDAFYGKKPYDSWSLNEITAQWDPPKPIPAEVEGSSWVWDEDTLDWKLETPPE